MPGTVLVLMNKKVNGTFILHPYSPSTCSFQLDFGTEMGFANGQTEHEISGYKEALKITAGT